MSEVEPLSDEDIETEILVWRRWLETNPNSPYGQMQCRWYATVEVRDKRIKELEAKLRRSDPDLDEHCKCGHTLTEHQWDSPCGECSCICFWLDEEGETDGQG